MLKKTLDFTDDGMATHGLQWDSHHIGGVMRGAEQEESLVKNGRRVCAIPMVIVERWKNEGFDVMKEDTSTIKKKAQEEGFYFPRGL